MLCSLCVQPLNGGCKVDVRVNESEKCTQSELDRVLFNTGPVKRQEITELITWKLVLL